jgi:tripartite-type tricarboxylate transporter receptor subunit TctC
MRLRRAPSLNLARAFALAIVFMTSASAARAEEIEWKRLSVFIGTTTGGSNDAYARLLARHIGKHLPGKPTVTPVNRPGAGGLTLINQMFATGATDGSEIATVAAGFVIDRVLYGDKSNARFEPMQFHWLGSLNRDLSIFVMRSGKGLTLDDVLAGKPLNVGSPGPGGPPWFYSRVLNTLLGAKMTVISGYPGMAEVLLGIENSELDGVAGVTSETVTTTRARWITSGLAKVVLQYALKRSAELQDVPAVMEIAKDPETRAVLEFLIGRDTISRPFFVPPNVPAERVALLQKAFDATVADAEFLDDARRINLAIDIVPAAEIKTIVAHLSTPEPAIAGKLRSMFQE